MNCSRLSCLALAFSLGALSLHAEEAASSPAEPMPAYELKKRSTFTNARTDERAPFWPIGWVKRMQNVAVTTQDPAAPQVQLDAKNFRVTSILLGAGATQSLAVINGRAYSEGEFLRMPKGGAVPAVRVRVQRIADGTVTLQNADQTLVASLARPELAERKAEELLTDQDR